MKSSVMPSIRHAGSICAMAILALGAGFDAKAVNAYDPASHRLTLDSVTVSGTTYQNVTILVNAFTLLGVDNGLAQADIFDPATKLLALGAVTYQGNIYYNVRVALNSYSLLSVGPSSVNYALWGAVARASVLAGHPVMPNPVQVNIRYESSVPQTNRDLIQVNVSNFVNRFSSTLRNLTGPIDMVAYSTLSGGLAIGEAYDPANMDFVKSVVKAFAQQPDPASSPCVMDGVSSPDHRLVAIAAPCYSDTAYQSPVTTHELVHQVQFSVLNGSNINEVAPKWLAEGQAQVAGAATSVQNGADNSAQARSVWIRQVPPNRTVADLAAMEGRTTASADPLIVHSEYTVGFGLAEYLIARSGFQKSLDVLQAAKTLELANGPNISTAQIMANFRTAFQATYGQSLDAFYQEALPYVNYLSTHSPMSSESSVEPGTRIFMTVCANGLTDGMLQQQVAGGWVDVAPVKGWDYAPTPACASGTYTPWTIANVPKGASLRWHLYVTGASGWDWYSPTHVY